MKFYKYWAVGEATTHRDDASWKLRTYGGSNEGLGDAQGRAREIAERAAVAIKQGRSPEQYGYADRPLREEIVQEIDGPNGLTAVITRNAHGTLVLNTSHVMFVDVDRENARANPADTTENLLSVLWNSLRGKPAPKKPDWSERTLSRFDEVSRTRGIGVRVYRTAGGFRLLMTSATFDPASSETNALLEELQSDPMYIRLCKVQECFRARLSAKYWRCGITKPPSRYPWTDAAEEATYRRWEQEYHERANRFATCELVAALGSTTTHDAVAPILETHDRLTIQPGATLA